MNERNVEALAGAIMAYLHAPEAEGGSHYIDVGGYDRPGDGGGIDHLAAFLAARGVLVPSALTYGQVLFLAPVRDYPPGPIPDEHPPHGLAFIRDMERIAKGEN